MIIQLSAIQAGVGLLLTESKNRSIRSAGYVSIVAAVLQAVMEFLK